MQLANARSKPILNGFVFVVVAFLVVSVRFALVQNAQIKKRSFENKIPEHVPLQIKIKKVKEQKVLDARNKDWYRDFELEVTNTSDKPIYFLSMNLQMPDLIGDSGGMLVFPLRYGDVKFYSHNAKPLPEDKPIGPKETYIFVVKQENKDSFEGWKIRHGKDDSTKLELTFNHLSYGDGTGFTTLNAIPFPVKENPEDLARCIDRGSPPAAEQ